jgi:TMEM199 family protein
MTRLRADEERRLYNEMLHPPSTTRRGTQGPTLSETTKDTEDELTYADINRQMTLILNVMISIVACGAAIWVVARHWATPARLAISMGGSGLVGVAEVVVYGGYLRRVGEAKNMAKKEEETKEIVRTWVVGGKDDGERIIDHEGEVTLVKKVEPAFQVNGEDGVRKRVFAGLDGSSS